MTWQDAFLFSNEKLENNIFSKMSIISIYYKLLRFCFTEQKEIHSNVELLFSGLQDYRCSLLFNLYL